MTPRRLVLVFSRAPRDERRARRLGGGDDGARGARVESLYRLLLERTLAVAAAAGADVRLVTTGALGEMERLARRQVPASRLSVAAQAGDGFVERLERALAGAFADGYGPVVLLGGDAPALTPRHLHDAFARLEAGADAVLGPARDGGYYLLALSSFSAAPFRDVQLRTRTVYAETRAALAAAQLTVATLDPLDDVDDLAAVAALTRSPIAGLRRAALALLTAELPSLPLAHAGPTARSFAPRDARGPPPPV